MKESIATSKLTTERDQLKAEVDRARKEILKKCPSCENTGKHLCPDVAEPIVVSCDRKGCIYGMVERLTKELAECKTENDELKRLVRAYTT